MLANRNLKSIVVDCGETAPKHSWGHLHSACFHIDYKKIFLTKCHCVCNFLSCSQQLELGSVYTPWAIRNGTMGTFFMNVYFERHLEDSIRELRRKLNLISPPQGSLSDNKVWVN